MTVQTLTFCLELCSVDSLTGLDGIDGVKILVNGNSNLMYRDVISLDSIFYMNNEIVEK